MEKRGIVSKDVTPDTEDKLSGEKQAGTDRQTELLDDDFTKRAAERAAKGLKNSGS